MAARPNGQKVDGTHVFCDDGEEIEDGQEVQYCSVLGEGIKRLANDIFHYVKTESDSFIVQGGDNQLPIFVSFRYQSPCILS